MAEKLEEKKELQLPDDVSKAVISSPRDLVIVSIPKMAKSTILGKLTEEKNGIVFDLEQGGYEYVNARKLSIYENNETTLWQAFQNYVKMRNLLLANKGKYEYLIIDGLTDLDVLSEVGGTLAYMNSTQGKSFNRADNIKGGLKLDPTHPEFKSVITLPEGYGYRHTREWFLEQIDIFRQIAPYRVYAAHIMDKYIKDNNKEQVVGSEIALTGQLKRIFASKVTALAKLVADENKRYLNFEVLNDSIIAGSRSPKLAGKILISEKDKEGNITTHWNNIYEN